MRSIARFARWALERAKTAPTRRERERESWGVFMLA